MSVAVSIAEAVAEGAVVGGALVSVAEDEVRGALVSVAEDEVRGALMSCVVEVAGSVFVGVVFVVTESNE